MEPSPPTTEELEAIQPGSGEREPAKAERLLSLDVFRGVAVLLMLLVNNIGGGFGVPVTLHHAKWGQVIHLADLAYPWFLFAVGIAIPFSMASFKKKGLPLWRYDLRVLRRMLLLIGLGFLLDTIRVRHIDIGFGVLQLIGIDFALAAFLYELPVYRRAILSVLLLLAYWVAILFIPIPHLGPGVFEEGRNIIEHVNRIYLAPIGLWGLPMVAPTLALVLFGTLAGDFLRTPKIRQLHKVFWLVGVGGALIALGALWSFSLAFNKPLWTSPFILFTAGTGAALLGMLYYVLDVQVVRQWAFPFAVFGSNALLAYMLSVGVKDGILIPYNIPTAGWIRVSIYVGIWWTLCWLLYRKRWFLRV